jgi:hypothetical protein
MKKIYLIIFTILPTILFSQVIIEGNFENATSTATTFFADYAQTSNPSFANKSTREVLDTNAPGNPFFTGIVDAKIVWASSNKIATLKSTSGVTLNDGGIRLGSATDLSLIMDIKHPGTNTSYVKSSNDIKVSLTFSGNLTTEGRSGRGIYIGFYGSLTSKYPIDPTSLDPTVHTITQSTYGALNNFIGFVVNPDTGKIQLWNNYIGNSENFGTWGQNYLGNFSQYASTQGDAWVSMAATGGNLIKHEISYIINSQTGEVYNFIFDGKCYDWSGIAPFSNSSTTNYFTIGSNSKDGKDALFHSVKVENVTAVPVISPDIAVTNWNGSSWSLGSPSTSKQAIISGLYDTNVNGEFSTDKLTIENTGSLQVRSGNTLTISNAIINKANASAVVVESGASIIQTNNATNIGSITINRNSAPMVRLDYTLWSSPVIGQNLFSFSPNTLQNRFYTYDGVLGNWDVVANLSTTFIPGRGYGVRAPDNFTSTPTIYNGIFQGVLNNGYYTTYPLPSSYNVSNNNFYLLGNPYASPISASTFVTTNGTRIDGTLYFYAHTLTKQDGTLEPGTSYATWNSTGAVAATTGSSGVVSNAPSGIIQPGQGFFVKSLNTLTPYFTNSMRSTNITPQSSIFLKLKTSSSKSSLDNSKLWLDLKDINGVGINQLLVGYVEGASNEEDNLYDGVEFGDASISLTSNLNGKNMVIQGRALPFVDSDSVALNFKTSTSGKYTIALSKTEGVFATSQEVYLKDNVTGIVQDLKQSPYTFAASKGIANNRFEILYNNANLNVIDLVNNSGIVAFKKEGVLQVNSSNEQIKEIIVYDIQGRQVFKQENVNNNSTSLPSLPSNRGILILKVVSVNNQFSTIKIIN